MVSERFRIDSGVRQGCIMSPWLFNVHINAVMKVKMGMRRRNARFLEKGREKGDYLASCMQMTW